MCRQYLWSSTLTDLIDRILPTLLSLLHSLQVLSLALAISGEMCCCHPELPGLYGAPWTA